jgi:ribonuclease D
MSGAVPLITKFADLAALAERLAREPFVAVDTEANSLHAYRERLCLVQFSTPAEDALVDPFAFEDLALLAPVFANPAIEKIFHAAEYDLIMMQRHYELTFTNLFDTMIAARILGRKKVGLGNLLEEDFGVKLEKKFQRADWGQRPLQPALLDYARMDTHYLIQLRNKLKKDLIEKGLWELAAEDFARQPLLVRAEEEQTAEVWRVKGSRDLGPRQAAILQELAVYRQSRAAQADLPLFKIMGDSTLTAIAKATPHTLDELKEIEGMSEGQVRRHGKALLDAVVRGEGAAPLRRPPRPPYDEAYVERVDKLRAWRKEAAKELDVESDVVLPRDIMESAARANPARVRELEPLMATVPWRFNKYASQIVTALHSPLPPKKPPTPPPTTPEDK